MLRQLSYSTRMIAAAATIALPTVGLAQDNRPVVVVFQFDNSSIGSGAADFAGVRTGVQDLLITELASNAKIRLVDRANINAIMAEQKMVKDQQVDPQTAVRLGKIFGAQYAVTGGFMSDGRGNVILTGRTIDIETTQIINPQKINGKADNVLGVIAELSTKLASNMNLAPKPGTGTGAGTSKSDAAKTGATQSGAPTGGEVKTTTGTTVQFAKGASKSLNSVKLDAQTLKTYSAALDEMDKKNNAKAISMFNDVLKAFPGFEPAINNLAKLGSKAGN
jgi:TolB-like protein